MIIDRHKFATILIFIVVCINTVIKGLALDFVLVGDPNNIANSLRGGAIDKEFEIGKYEISNEEYCAFLNCVARKSDIHNLYAPIMGQHFLGGIVRIKDSDGYYYKVKEGYNNLPAGGISWNSAVRYVNWLHYNSFQIENNVAPSEFIPETEGTDKCGAYDTRDISNTKRNSKAIYWLPNEDEWNKACFFDGIRWIEDWSDIGVNCFDSSEGWKYPYPHLTQNTTGYIKESHYGTLNQLGNLAEWVENKNGKFRKAMGGSLIRPKEFSHFGQSEGDYQDKSIISFGFRVCRNPNRIARLVSQKIPTKSLEQTNIPQTYKLPVIADKNGGTYVLVNYENNDGDPINQYKGCVGYQYYISKYELTNSEYCKFLNATTRKGDPFKLYNENMNKGVCGGIEKHKLDNEFKYTVKAGWENRPVVYIGFYELARYANWLHYGCPDSGKSQLHTTEGTSQSGAYDTSDFESVRKGFKPAYKNFGKRNQGALYWIPNEDEWYKAAYYDPTIIGNRKYYDYPTRSSTPPSSSEANYLVGDSLSIGSPYFVALVSQFENSSSFFGTQQQGGNVWEWIESWQYGQVGVRGLKGGSWSYTEYGLNALNTDPGGINDVSYLFGGRLCKAFDKAGWQPSDKDAFTLIKQYVSQLSTKRLIIVIGCLAFFLASLIIALIILCFKLKRVNANN